MTTKTKIKYGAALALWWNRNSTDYQAAIDLRGLYHDDNGGVEAGFGGGLDRVRFLIHGSASRAIEEPESLGFFYRGDWGIDSWGGFLNAREVRTAAKHVHACEHRWFAQDEKQGRPVGPGQTLLRALRATGASHYAIQEFEKDGSGLRWYPMKELMAQEVDSLVSKHRAKLINLGPDYYRALTGHEQPEDFKGVAV